MYSIIMTNSQLGPEDGGGGQQTKKENTLECIRFRLNKK